MDEIHKMPYSRHPNYQKAIATTRNQYFWLELKKYVFEYIAKCMKC
jgi:hypothetical protein